MRLNYIKNLLLLLFLFKLVLNDQTVTLPTHDSIPIYGNGEETMKVELDSDGSFQDYFRVKFNLKEPTNRNPAVIISTDKGGNDRLFTSVQLYDEIYIFLRKKQIADGPFYIAIKNRENSNVTDYTIEISNQDKAYLPFNKQTSYYISDDEFNNITEFVFQKDGSESTDITFWAQGKSIYNTNMDGFTSGKFDSTYTTYTYYGPIPTEEDNFTLEVNSVKGDYITVGSVTLNDKLVYNGLKENRNEILVASEKDEVCFEISFGAKIMHITGKIYTFKATGTFKDSNNVDIYSNGKPYKTSFTNGILSDFNAIGRVFPNYKTGYYCLDNPGLKIISIQMTCNAGETQLITPPLLPGDIRRHFLLRGEVGIFYGTKPRLLTKEVNLNLKALKGFPEMYYTECLTFPNCHYTPDKKKGSKLEYVYPSNRFSVYSFYMDDIENSKFNPITSAQPLMVVYCAEGGKQDIFGESAFCTFETSIFTSDDHVLLPQESTFSQYLLIDESDHYQVHFPQVAKTGTKIYLDLMIFSGDVDLNCTALETSVQANKYYLSNKIFYSVHLLEEMENIIFKVVGISNAFYMVQYQIINSDDQSDDENTIESGVNFITTKSVGNKDNLKKILNLMNFKAEFNQPYLVTFYSPNCIFGAFWDENPGSNDPFEISNSSNYGYKVISPNEVYYKQEQYKFYYEIQQADPSKFSNKFCVVNVAGLELSHSNTEWNGRSISLSEGVPHTYVFSNDYPLIYYSYHVSNIDNTLVLNFNLIDKEVFNVTIKINGKKFSDAIVYRNTQLYVKRKDFDANDCNDEEICTVDVEILMSNSTRVRKVEFTMYQLDGLPFYLEKNVLKDDVLIGNHKNHYYFDISKDEYGDITLDFKRGSGLIYASVVKRINPDKPENPDWRGLYKFPTSMEGTLKYRTYEKKIIIDPTNTEGCDDEGCYVLITIESNVNTQSYEETPFRISIIPRILKNGGDAEIPIVKIKVNEFIIGDISKSQIGSAKYDYYTLTLPYDSDYILIDWQADYPTLIVNVGQDRPTIDKHQIDFPFIGHDTVFRINRTDIIEKISSDVDDSNKSLRGIDLTIGIYTNATDSIQSSPYAFKLFMPPIVSNKTDKKEIVSAEIIHIRSDQKVQCLPFEFDTGIYICLFAVIFDDSDIMNNLVAYPRTRDDYPIEIYRTLVKAEYIERNNIVALYINILNTFKEENKIEQNYVYVENIHKDEAVFLIVKADDPQDIIEVLSSTYNIKNSTMFFPNPSTPQILAIRNNTVDIEILTSQDLLINLGSVSGLGQFYWADQEKDETKHYYLYGPGDRLFFTTYNDDLNNLYTPLIVNSLTSIESKEGGFIFYITYYPRSYIDQVKSDRITEFHYRTVQMPLNYYVPVNLFFPNTINFNIYNMDTENGDDLVYDSELFDIWGTIISEAEAIRIRIDPKFRPNIDDQDIKIKRGVFDITFGALYFSINDMNDMKPKDDGGNNNTLNIFFTIEKNKSVACNFTSFGLELDISSLEKEFGAEPVPEEIYLTGNLNNSLLGRKTYRLKLNTNNIYLRIEYSANSYFVDYILSADIRAEESDPFNYVNIKEEYGRKVLIIQFDEEYFSKNNDSLYFTIFGKNRKTDPKLQYFVIKYVTSQTLESLTDFFVPNSKLLEVTGDKPNYLIKFSPLNYANNVIYYIKAVYKDQADFDENIYSIAISEAKGINVQITKPQMDDEKIYYNLKVDKDISYIKVLARSNFIFGKYIYLYSPYDAEIELITFSNPVAKTYENADKKKKYELIFNSQKLTNYALKADDIPNYIKVKVSNYKGNQPPILYFSPTDSKCIDNRQQLAKGGEMWIKKEQFEGEHFYILVECLDDNECDYTLTFSGNDTVVSDSMGFFNYFVSVNNTDMVFKFINDRNSNGERITLYATGGRKISISLDGCSDESCKPFDFTDGEAITTKTTGNDYFTLTVTAEIGDYISVGAKIIDNDGKCSENTLSSEIGQISGFLRKEILDKECYLLPGDKDIYYITGTLYNSYAIVGLTGPDLKINETDAKFARKGFFAIDYDNSIDQNDKYLCISIYDTSLYEVESFSYSIQLQSKSNYNGNNYPPQYPGAIYPRIIPTGQLAYFNYIFPKIPSLYTVYNMITTEGYPKMFVYECFTYPFCNLNYSNLEENENVKRISDINRMSTYFVETKKTGFPIEAHQYILVVKCNEANGDESDNYNHCQFMTSIFGEKEEVSLLERQPFGQYMIKGDTDQFLIDFSQEKKDKMKIHIDFYVVSGDVSFDLRDKDTNNNITDIHKYYLANKIFYSLTIDRKNNRNTELKRIKIQTSAKRNSYYIIEYKILREELEEKTNTILSSINYLVPISQNSTGQQNKSIIIKGVKIVRPIAFIDTFYSLNCKIDIRKVKADGEEEQIPSFGDYGQEFHQFEDDEKMNDERPYIVSINKDGKYVLNAKDMCMIYVSGLEIYDNNSGVRKEILLSEGVPHLVHFDPDLKIMRYVYPHADPRNNLTVSINMIVPGKFKVKYFFREQDYNIDNDVSHSTILYIPYNMIQTGCQEEDELCSVTVQLENIELFDGVEPQVEIIIKQIKNTPYYVPRGIIRKDYISGDAYLFIYTDVGLEIYQETPDDNADWRNYRFIRNKDEDGSLYYDFYNKKLVFSKSDTQKCGDGCYILISIKTSVYKEGMDDSEYQYFTLLADFTPKNYEEKRQLPKLIQLVPEEYVIGSLFKKDKVDNNKLFEYYTFQIPYNISALEIDWQSDIAELYINVGQKRPDGTNKADFNFTERRDINIRISRLDILKKMNGDDYTEDGQSLLGMNIVFGIYTKYYNSIGSTPYAFRVHLPKPELNIYKIISDQKAICKPEKLSDKEYRCLFMIIYHPFQLFNDLIVYAKSQSPSAKVNMFANFVEYETYDSYDIQKLKDKIPTETNSQYNTKREQTKFIFLSYGDFESYAFISVISDKPDDIELYTSFKTFEDRLSPNPSTAQVYSMDLHKQSINIDFITTKSLAVNIMSLYGEARLYLEKDPQSIFYLRGAEDSIDYIIKGREGESLLVVENLRYEKTEEYKEPGFAFILEFYLRSQIIELDLLKIDETLELAYKQADFPVYYYAKVFDKDNDINAFFYLHNIIYDSPEYFERTIVSDELEIKATIIEESKIYEIQEDSSKLPSLRDLTIRGVYDSTLQAGSILIPKNKLKSMTLPTIFIAIEKGQKGQFIKYNRIRGEYGLSTINGDAPVTPKLYQFGKIKNYRTLINYKLATDINNTDYMRIQFSSNSKYVNFAINKVGKSNDFSFS